MQKQWRDKGREYLVDSSARTWYISSQHSHSPDHLMPIRYYWMPMYICICIARLSLCLRLNFGVYALSYSKFGLDTCLMSDVLDMFSYLDSFWMYFYFSNDCCTSRRWKLGLQKYYGNVYILFIAGNRADAKVVKSYRRVQFNVGSPSTE